MITDRVNQIARRVPNWLVYILGISPAGWFLYLGLTGGLGAEPIKSLEHELGEFALKLLIAGLCITPLRKHLGVNLIKFRRAIGVLAFTYVFSHLLPSQNSNHRLEPFPKEQCSPLLKDVHLQLM